MIKAIAIDDEPLALTVLEAYCAENASIELVKTFTQPGKALEHLRRFPVDLIFVDINMPGMTGLQLVKSLQEAPMVIFTTAYSEYAVQSYEVNALDYLLKPISVGRFEKAVNKAEEYHQFLHKLDSGPAKQLYVRADYSLIKVDISEILYIEGLADYVKIYIKDRKTIVSRMTMKELIDKLPQESFIRIHRSYIVPFHRIAAVRSNTVLLEDAALPIGKTYQTEFYERYR